MWRRRDQCACTPCIADPYLRRDDYDQDERNVPEEWGHGPDPENGNDRRRAQSPLHHDREYHQDDH